MIDIPPGFGRDLLRGNKPEVGFYVDGSAPFNAENIKAYVGGIFKPLCAQDQIRATGPADWCNGCGRGSALYV